MVSSFAIRNNVESRPSGQTETPLGERKSIPMRIKLKKSLACDRKSHVPREVARVSR